MNNIYKKKIRKREEVHEPLLPSSNNTKSPKLFETSRGLRYLNRLDIQVRDTITGWKNLGKRKLTKKTLPYKKDLDIKKKDATSIHSERPS